MASSVAQAGYEKGSVAGRGDDPYRLVAAKRPEGQHHGQQAVVIGADHAIPALGGQGQGTPAGETVQPVTGGAIAPGCT